MTRVKKAEGGRRKADRRRRKGVILLVVLALLSLFTLMLITFVIGTAHFRVSAKGLSKVEQSGDPPDALNHSAFLQIVRGPRNPASAMGAHGLLEDMYGNRPLRARVDSSTISGIGNGQIVHFNAEIVLNAGDLDPTDGFYNGRLLTFVDGPAAGRSTRIVGSGIYTAGNPATMEFDVLAVPGLGISTSNPAYMNFIINGRPFSGTGFGFRQASFDPTTPNPPRLLDAADADDANHVYALLPNHSTIGFKPNAAIKYYDPAGPGGANEDYDAPDFQNMLLAVRTFSAAGVEQVPLPSLHRPDLINYWNNYTGGPKPDPGQYILRPLQRYHPNFTGSNPNPNFNPETDLQGPWDVDNDGEGTPDSIWVDLGMPVQTAPDGRTYKPLFAILCIDLDGKLNLNAHGNLTHMDLAAGKTTTRFSPITGPLAVVANATAQATPLPVLRAGQGLGPPEISLHHLFKGFANEYLNLLTGLAPPSSSEYVDGRYGEVQRKIPLPGNPGEFYQPGPGMTRICDPLAWVMQSDQPQLSSGHLAFEHATYAYTDVAFPSSYGTPADLDGDSMLALDLHGQPLYIAYTIGAGWGEVSDRVDSAYELDLSLNARHAGFSSTERFGNSMGTMAVGPDMNGKVSSVDAPFTAAELERLLRYNDIDATGLPDRLLRLAPNAFNSAVSPKLRNLVTYGSFDLPVPSMVFTSPEMMKDVFALAGGTKTPALFDANITQLLRAKLVRNGIADGSVAMQDAMKQLLWPELVMGVKMDINRPLGNGRDDNGNKVVDEPDALPTAENEWSGNEIDSGGPVPDLNNDGTRNAPIPSGADRRVRQLLARHLYVLMMLLVDENPNPLRIDIDGKPGNDTPRETARAIAQWAVNMVDFRDPDAIMTPFEFDIFPFKDDDAGVPGTWDVDDIVSTQTTTSADDNEVSHTWRGLAWGVERPELLISETLAFHDLKTEDEASDTDKSSTTTDPMQPDDDFDQKVRPEGSFFVELYNPNSPMEAPHAEFASVPYQPGVDLGKKAPDGAPVWRLAVYLNPTPAAPKDPEDPFDRPDADHERNIYFTPIASAALATRINGTKVSYTPNGLRTVPLPYEASARVLPNRYAVIGPAANTYVGENNSQDLTTTRSISLLPKRDHTISTQVNVKNNVPAPGVNYPNTTQDIQTPVSVIVDSPRRMSVSEPTAGYLAYAMNATSYSPPIDTPLDYVDPALKLDGTTFGYRMVHLQRLANPLMPWDAKANPYITVDSAPVDVTPFNGVATTTDPSVDTDPTKPVVFETRERGDSAAVAAVPATAPMLWPQEPSQPANLPRPASLQEAPITHKFPYALKHTLGYLNKSYGAYWDRNIPPQLLAGGAASDYIGCPKLPFPWLSWNNRPYASTMELALVPATRSSKLFNVDATTNSFAFSFPSATDSPYNRSAPLPAGYGAYPHLLNLFHSQGNGARGSSHLYRLLEYVQVPSKFTGTDTWFDAARFGAGTGAHTFHPPFNHVSNFRDPGRININTIFDQEGAVWGGILDSLSAGTALQNNVARSRRGNQPGNIYDLDPAGKYPTIFAKPFRSYGGNTLVPLDSMRDPISPGHEIDSTLLRAYPTGSNKPLFEVGGGAPYSDPTRNPYFRYQELNRVSNMVTTRSNVYAIWITVGYFEVKYHRIDNEHPDGYELGAELGSDTGDIQRHRSFYIYDRSIPVGFQRGENHNVEDGIMVQRFIE